MALPGLLFPMINRHRTPHKNSQMLHIVPGNRKSPYIVPSSNSSSYFIITKHGTRRIEPLDCLLKPINCSADNFYPTTMLISQSSIRVHEHDLIVLADGTVLSALIWMPKDADSNPVPAILEYLPYRKRDGTAERDALNHPYIAGHGYACVRVDMRGSGDSEGVLLGEYLKQELDDALEVLRWIATRRWCTGSVGMIGISWGGFNGLQVAALQPPELKAVISLCSTDDRYADDVHYMGGCQLVDNLLWGGTMLSIAPAPPDPALVGDTWRDLWLQRLENGAPYIADWHQHQRRDEFWRHASICEDYSMVKCPVFLVSGWQDPYSNAVFRMLGNLQCPKMGLIGPWGHKYPHFAKPGPQIGFLQESLRWWDYWLKGKDTGLMNEPLLRCYMQHTAPPKRYYPSRPGHWIAENTWPSPGVTPLFMGLGKGRLTDETFSNFEKISFCSPQTVGFSTGRWISYGSGGDLPGDQNEETAGSEIFHSQPLPKSLHILGPPKIYLRIASNKPNAMLAAVLSEVLPDGSATRLTYGLQNLTHRDSHINVRALQPGEYYDITVQLNDIAQCLSPGSVVRLALSTTYFPTAWPSPESATLTVDCTHSKIELPVRQESPLDSGVSPFKPAISGTPLKLTTMRETKDRNTITKNLETGEMTVSWETDEGLKENPVNGWRWGGVTSVTCGIRPDDPLSANVEQRFRQEFGRSEQILAIEGWSRMTASRTDWLLATRLEAWEQGERVFEKEHAYTIPRDHA